MNSFVAKKSIQVFEHQKLFVDDVLFTQAHWEALVLFNEIHGGKYCSLGYNYIKWGSCVGVIQVRDLIIEILPKVDALQTEGLARWQNLLLDMLMFCDKLKVNKAGSAQQQVYTSSNSLLHIYFELFAQEVELVFSRGLVRSYERKTVNNSSWKGQWQVAKHLQKNIIHQERCLNIQDKYILAHPIHEVLNQAIALAIQHAPTTKLQQRFLKIYKAFPKSTGNKVIDWGNIAKLQEYKKFKKYQEALNIARLLLLNYTPNLQAGNYATLGVLFDMNQLFEEYVYRLLSKNKANVDVLWQPARKFWNTKMLRPDILLEKGAKRWVIDVKWKIPKQGKPSDQDLRQIYTYIKAFNAESGLLIYPKSNQQANIKDHFLSVAENEKIYGNVLFLDILEHPPNMPKQHLAEQILTFLNIS